MRFDRQSSRLIEIAMDIVTRTSLANAIGGTKELQLRNDSLGTLALIPALTTRYHTKMGSVPLCTSMFFGTTVAGRVPAHSKLWVAVA